MAMSLSTLTSANDESSDAISASRRSSSTVTDMLTSEVLTTSIGARQRSNTSNTRRRNPCAMSMRVEVTSTTVMWRLQASAASGPSTGELPVMSVPVPPNLRLFRIRTGMALATAGRIVLGCSTLAPK